MTELKPHSRGYEILIFAIKQAEKIGYYNLKLRPLAKYCNVPHTLLSYYFGSIHELKMAVLKKALETNNYVILTQALIRKDPYLNNLSRSAKANILRNLV